ncbi:hypothetical protein JMJ35_009387 [Cladonia borealis]|uniref:MARVEL domain-containing protein n=1 Tax=Cladonia borealis TaxID=184061 RepID=A0AA39UY27_9LECA|nr:hypothetical protein JMJ35_009387 [Cladonia borealis]
MLNLNTPFRTIQGLLAIIALGLNGYVTSWYRAHTHPSTVPNESPFLLFCAAWTLLLLPYLLFNPPLSQTRSTNPKPPSRFFNKHLLLTLDLLTALLWFSGFVALAVFKSRLILCLGHVCQVMIGAVAVGVLAWLSFCASSVLAGLHVWRTRRGGEGGQVHGGWVGKGNKATVQV